MRALALALLAGLTLARPLAAVESELSAPVAASLVERGEAVLIDVRTPTEWRQTGVPEGALTIPLQGPDLKPRADFPEAVKAALGGDTGRPVVLICRTGNRSAVAMEMLRRAGFTAVGHIGEGMAGSRHGAGWLARGLPVSPCQRC